MALLTDPTIQRILEEVNKAATGGALGSAGNYLSQPFGPDFPPIAATANQSYEEDDSALFYPPVDLFQADGSMNFDQNFNFNALPTSVPIVTPNNFDLYNSNIYDTMQRNFPSSYEHYHHISKSSNEYSSAKPEPAANNEVNVNQHSQMEYSKKTNTVPNLGLNVRTPTPPISSERETIKIPETVEHSLDHIAEDVPIENNETHPILSSSMPNEDLNLSLDSEHLNAVGQIFYDPNPQVIQRKGSHSVTYQQNVIVRFLQPPPIPSVGPLVIKEVRPPQPPPLPPLVIKQRPTPPKTPPPVVIRERPPPLPAACATKVITRQLPAEPAPPRSVVIERLPPLPQKPRDIIIERWLPYQILNPKRKVVVQRAQKSSAEHPTPKNIIITYEPVQAKVVRNFQKQTVIREDPQTYAKRYASQLCDFNTVLQQARALGVYEDLNPASSPTNANNSMISHDLSSVSVVTNNDTLSVENNQMARNYDEKSKSHDEQEQQNIGTVPTALVSSDDNNQDEDVMIEENITPFYMTSDQNFHQTLQRLGIDVRENPIFNPTFQH